MSSAEQNSPKDKISKADQTTDNGSLQSPPKRPTLVSPPRRPAGRPSSSTVETQATPAQEPENSAAESQASQGAPAAATSLQDQVEPSAEPPRCQPIAPPSEPMQYRAIGLVRGTYQPTEADQLNRGTLNTEDGAAIDAVLLGRVTSLVKKHIDLADSHLWVVYPRTRRNDDNEDQDLHLQIVGVWEPETLGLPGEPSPKSEHEAEETAAETDDEENKTATDASQPASDLPPVSDNYFSIRGEVVKYSPDDEQISVKILQGVKRSPGSSKPFKVNLKGTIEGRTIGYFWDFKAKRENQLLILEDASVVGIVPPKKRAKKKGGRQKPTRGGNRPMPNRRSVGAREHRPRRIDANEDLRA